MRERTTRWDAANPQRETRFVQERLPVLTAPWAAGR